MDDPEKADGQSRERRGMRRDATDRDASFLAPDAGSARRVARVIDISPDGLRLGVAQALEPGTQLEIEVAPRAVEVDVPGFQVLGKVAWCAPAGNAFEAGVRVQVNPRGFASAPRVMRKRESAQRVIEEPVPRFREGDMLEIRPAPRRAVPNAQQPASRAAYRWTAFIVVGVMIAVLLLGWATTCQMQGKTTKSLKESEIGNAQDFTRRAAAPPPTTAAGWPEAAVLALRSGDLIEARKDFEVALAGGTANATLKLLAGIGVSEAMQAGGDAQAAKQAIGQALDAARDAAPEWRAVAEEYKAALESNAPDANALLAFGDAVPIVDLSTMRDDAAAGDVPQAASAEGKEGKEGKPGVDLPEASALEADSPQAKVDKRDGGKPSADEAKQGTDTSLAREDTRPPRHRPPQHRSAGTELRLRVDLSSFVMTVHRGAEVLRRYPVGLGYGDSTPRGTFQIANKLTNPDWYNRGKVVRAGDKRNPLGAYWMGLGTGGGATPYGIHPTSDTRAIGRKHSRGCIRMRQADAADLFALAPVGTMVEIR